jgi:hypothetical protein
VAAPLSVLAYDGNGARVSGVHTQFFITDTGRVAHIDTTTNFLFGDNSGTIHIIGQIGALQTPVATIPVTFRPAAISAGLTKIDTLRAPLGADSTAAASVVLPVVVQSANDSASQGIIVHFALLRAPATAAGKPPAAILFDNSGNASVVDTTNGSGSTTRRLVVRSAFLLDTALLAGHKAVSAIVVASASYRGAPLSGSPLTLVVPIKVVLK